MSLTTGAQILREADRLSWLGNWPSARPLYLQAEREFHRTGDSKSEEHARIGRIRSQAGRRPLGETINLLTAELNSRQVQDDPKLRLWCLVSKGAVTTDYQAKSGEKDWNDALQLAVGLHDQEWAARAKGELGVLLFLKGDTASAVSFIGSAIFSAFATGDTASQVRLLTMLGFGFNEEHRYAEAEIIFDRAISIAGNTRESAFPVQAYRGKAAALAGEKNEDAALRLLGRALDVARFEESLTTQAELLIQIGEVEIAAGANKQAEENLQTAAGIAQRMQMFRSISEAMLKLSELQTARGAFGEARDSLNAGLSASKFIGDRYYLPRDLTALAELSAREKHWKSAEALFGEAEDVIESIVNNENSFEESAAHAGSMSSTYLEHYELEVRRGKVAEALGVLERVRGRAMAAKLSHRGKIASSSAQEKEIRDEIAETQLDLLLSSDPARHGGNLEKLVDEERRLAFVRNESRRETNELDTPPALSSLQRIMRSDELMVEYVLGTSEASCIAITHQAAQIFRLKSSRADIERLSAAYLSELRLRNSGEPYASELYQLLLLPIMKSFPESHLIISPDGVLHSIPFEALKDQQSYILQSKIISYIPSAAVFYKLRATKFNPVPKPLLAIGAVEYELAKKYPQDSGSLGSVVLRGLAELSGSRLQDLPASLDEINSISSIVGTGAEKLLGQDATEGEFKKRPLDAYRVIHFAAHALADPQYPDRAAIVLGKSLNEDGLLQLREIMHLKLNANLVTLSACDTLLGADRNEAGIVNLVDAFLIAGSRSVVASLWNVEDSSTSVLMKRFYTHLAMKEDESSAMTAAKRELLSTYGGELSPYYWAGFVLTGDPIPPKKIKVPTQTRRRLNLWRDTLGAVKCARASRLFN